ncbi:MAG: glutamine-hydrolyzing carbamoyl-phosphate synthase small subunit [Armatimonadetes bacterium]|nr:glutamine-hydrolyzing carbamoyl-phosphate synthase small subunit [Armatimonadota bacterium]
MHENEIRSAIVTPPVRTAHLALEDGMIFSGPSIGAAVDAGGEVVFTTSMTGYVEVLTDPSYAGQIVTMAFPMIGTYGVNKEWAESRRPFLRGFVVRHASAYSSHWAGTQTITDYLRAWGIPGIADIDTRKLVRHLRASGLKRGVLATGNVEAAALVSRARALPDPSDEDLVGEVLPDGSLVLPGGGPRIALLDCGVKTGIAHELNLRGCEVVVLPGSVRAHDVLALAPDGLMLSNGPGDPARLEETAAEVRKLWGKLPIFGVCLGNQILALAAGARTFKLPFGHRGSNHPVMDQETGRIRITTQNHGYAVEEESLKANGMRVTHRNLHDDTVEGLRHESLPVWSVQFHPEARPGPRDSRDLFDKFLAVVADVRRGARTPAESA